MRKSIVGIIAVVSAVTVSLGGCSLTAEKKSTDKSEAAPVIAVLGEYALLGGHTMYTSADGGFSVQLPEGSVVNDANPNDITITLASAYVNADMLSITKKTGVQAVTTTDELYQMLKDDDTIDITGFFTLSYGGAYKGYKYTYTSTSNANNKGIVSTYFAADGSAYIVKAIINNGGNEQNVENVNTVVDTFVSYI